MLFGVVSPPSGSQTATVSWTTAATAEIIFLTASGVNQGGVNSGTFNNGGTAFANGAVSIAITSADGDLTSTVGKEGSSVNLSTNQTERWAHDATPPSQKGDTGPGTANPTHTWTPGQLANTCMSGANFVASAVAFDILTTGGREPMALLWHEEMVC